jgi:hypothetical protein
MASASDSGTEVDTTVDIVVDITDTGAVTAIAAVMAERRFAAVADTAAVARFVAAAVAASLDFSYHARVY